MFTGIVESIGEIEKIEKDQSNIHFGIRSKISPELKVDQSVSHDGVCLTVTKVEDGVHWVTAVDETLRRSTLSNWANGHLVNLERCMKADGRFDGHIVQGHVDRTGEVKEIVDHGGSWEFSFDLKGKKEILVDKGSICVNGVSLTCFDTSDSSFKVAIIPYTFEHTNFHKLKVGSVVNLEFDILGKYIQKIMAQRLDS